MTPRMPAAPGVRYVACLKNGARVEALDVELLPGWTRLLVPRSRLEVDETARVGRHVPEGATWEAIPASRVRKVIGPLAEGEPA